MWFKIIPEDIERSEPLKSVTPPEFVKRAEPFHASFTREQIKEALKFWCEAKGVVVPKGTREDLTLGTIGIYNEYLTTFTIYP